MELLLLLTGQGTLQDKYSSFNCTLPPRLLLSSSARIEFKVAVFYTVRRRKWKNLCPCYDNFMPCCLFVPHSLTTTTCPPPPPPPQHSTWCTYYCISLSTAPNALTPRWNVRQFVPIFKRRYIHQARPMVITLSLQQCFPSTTTTVRVYHYPASQPAKGVAISSLCYMSTALCISQQCSGWWWLFLLLFLQITIATGRFLWLNIECILLMLFNCSSNAFLG